METNSDKYMRRFGFSLAEVIATLTIGAMILVAILGVFNRAERSAAAVTHKLDSSRLPREVLQRIAEDLGRIISSDSDTKIVINNKYDAGLPTARMVIRKTIKDSEDKEVIFEEITWRGVMLTLFLRKYSAKKSILITGLGFSLLHLVNLQYQIY